MNFNPDPSKQTQEIIFSRKTNKISHPSLRFNINIVSQTQYQKQLGIFLDGRLTFEEHLNAITSNYRTFAEIVKNFAKTGINDCAQRFCDTTSRLW